MSHKKKENRRGGGGRFTVAYFTLGVQRGRDEARGLVPNKGGRKNSLPGEKGGSLG